MRKKWYKIEGDDYAEALHGTAKAIQRKVRMLHKAGILVTMRCVKNRAEQRQLAETGTV